MPDCMMFPSDWRDFIKDYSFIDTEHIYTNGSELIQVLRVNQLIEHLLKEQEDGYKNILSDYEDLAREHEKLLDKKIPLITNGQEVVRCKDCKYWWYGNYCDKHGKGQENVDWFCADGVKKDD